MKSIVIHNAPTLSIRYVMGLKKRSLSRSGAANQLIIATKNRSSWYPGRAPTGKASAFSGTSRGRRAGGAQPLIAEKETSALSSRPKLQSRQLRIHPFASDEFVMLTNFHNAPFVEHDDAVGFLDGGQAMRDDKSRAVLHGAF
jgi:hypothetical protein